MAKFIQPSFAKGVIAPSLYGRVDTAAYQVALAKGKNAIIHTYGGVSNRTGLEFIGETKFPSRTVRLIPFEFKATDTYMLEFGHQYMRVIRNEAYVTEAPKAITGVTQANPAVVTSNAHGYSNGDEIEIFNVQGMTELNTRRFLVSGATANTFALQDKFGTNIDSTNYTAYTSGGNASKIYEIATPYVESDLLTLKWVQSADVMTLTHPLYAVRDLSRADHDNWTLEEVVFTSESARPASLTVTVNTTGTRTQWYTVTAVNAEGQESLSGINDTGYTISNITQANPAVVTATGHNHLDGDEVEIRFVGGMTEINNRRYIVKNRTNNTFELLGVDSTGFGAYTSNGTTHQTFVRIANGNPTTDNTISWSATADAVKYYVYRKAVDGVWGFIGESTTASFTDNDITSDASAAPPTYNDPLTLMDNYPGTTSYYEQRQIYAGSINKPDTIYYSRTGDRKNLSAADPAGAADGFSTTLAARQVNEIRHMVPLNDLIVLTSGSEWRVNSGPDTAFELASVRQKPQSFWGCSHLPPYIVGTTVFFVEPGQSRVRTIGYSFQIDGYTGTNISLLANHYFEDESIRDWTVQILPETRFYVCRSDGAALSCTFDAEQEVIAWTDWETDGNFENCASLRAPAGSVEDQVYFVVRRTINGNTVRYIEKLHPRHDEERIPESGFYIDSGLSLDSFTHITNVTAANPPVVTTAAHGLSNGDEVEINGIIWEPNVDEFFGETQPIQAIGRYVVNNVTTNTFELQNDQGVNIDGSAWNAYRTGGEVRRAFNMVGGLWHLEGESLVANADGNVVRDLEVLDGSVLFPRKFARVHIGLPYITELETLDIEPVEETIQGYLKKVSDVTVKFEKSRGMVIGPKFEELTEMKQREFERHGEPTRLLTGSKKITITSDWNQNGRIFIRQKDPMPLNIISLVKDLEVSDI